MKMSVYVNKENAVRVWTAAKPWLVFAVELAVFIVLWALYQVCRGLTWLGDQAEVAVCSGRIFRAAEDFYRWAEPRKTGEIIIAALTTLVLFGPIILLATLFMFAGIAAEKFVRWVKDPGGAV